MRDRSGSIIPIDERRPKPLSHRDRLVRAARNPVRRRKREVTRSRLLAATAKMLSAHGYFGLRVADIAAAAGLSTAAFHVYFTGREEAAREVLSGLLGRLYIADLEEGARSGRSFTAMIRRHLEAVQADAPLVRALSQAVLVDGVLAELSDHALRLWRARLDTTLYGVDGRCLDARPTPDVPDMIVAGMMQAAMSAPLGSDDLSRLAAEIGRAWEAAAGTASAPPAALRGVRGEMGLAHA